MSLLVSIIALLAILMFYGMITNSLEGRKRLLEAQKIVTLFNDCLARNAFPVIVNYDVKWAGKAEQAPTHFYAERVYNYPTAKGLPPKLNGIKETKIELLSFERKLTTEDVLREIKKQGYRPAEWLEYQSFDKKFLHPPFEFPIIFLGVVAIERFNYPPVTRTADGVIAIGCNGQCCNQPIKDWTTENIYNDRQWSSECCFAAVRLTDDEINKTE